jgi:gentisate 1,2-dioxygenase
MTTTTGMSMSGSGGQRTVSLFASLKEPTATSTGRWSTSRAFIRRAIYPQATAVTQSIETHIEVYAPGAYGQKHGHLNSAVFYVLKGRGHDIHDGKRIEWRAGDVMIVENGCVHQHFNDDPDNEAILLVFKAKPLFLFMHLLFQKIVSYPPTEPPKGHEDFKPPTDL